VNVSRDTRRWLELLDQPIALVSLALDELRGEITETWIRRLHEVADGISRDRLTRVELQLLPILATALNNHFSDHPATALALGTKRRAAAETLIAETAARAAAEALEAHGLSTAPLKGLALAETYEQLGWRRPMGDADLLILDPTSWSEVEASLRDSGFALATPYAVHARNFDLPDGRRVDVHRFISTPNAFPDALQGLRVLASTADQAGRLGKALPPEVHMAHAIEHAMRWSPIVPARSISDIVALQQANVGLDWKLVHELLVHWSADRNGHALLARLVEAVLIPSNATWACHRRDRSEDRWLQAWSTTDPRRTWIKQPVVFFGLIPRRLARKDTDFKYSEYLRNLWSLDAQDSIAPAVASRVRRRLISGRKLTQYNFE